MKGNSILTDPVVPAELVLDALAHGWGFGDGLANADGELAADDLQPRSLVAPCIRAVRRGGGDRCEGEVGVPRRIRIPGRQS